MGPDGLLPSERAALEAFLKLADEDRAAGRLRPLVDYLSMEPFRPHSDLLAREWWFLQQTDPMLPPGAPAVVRSTPRDDPTQQVAHYRLIRVLGRGGQGVVHLAEDLKLHRTVALKLLVGLRGADVDETLLHFRREAELTARLSHPGICVVHDIGIDRGLPYIVMRYVDGCSLADRIQSSREQQAGARVRTVVDLSTPRTVGDTPPKRPPLTPEPGEQPPTRGELGPVLRLFEKVASALHTAHETKVIHRDIKPGNILVTEEGEPVIVDFGLAREVQGGSAGYASVFAGTPRYASPEQFHGRSVRLDGRTDVYSLGATLYEALTLQMPFNDLASERLTRAIQSKEPVDVRDLNPTVPSDLAVVVRKAMAKDADDRYQTAADFAEDLRRVRMREPILAKPAGPIRQLWRWSQRNRALASATASLFVVLTVGLATTFYLLSISGAARIALTTANDAKQQALNDLREFQLLSAATSLEQLRREADDLWPADPSKTDAMRRWLRDATSLIDKLPELESSLARLRGAPNVEPYSDADQAGDAARLADQEVRPFVAWANRKTAGGPDGAALSQPTSRATVHHRLTWRFTGDTKVVDEFKHAALARVVTDLKAFAEPDPKKGVLASVRERLAFASRVKQDTIEKYRDRWDTAIAAIKAEPKYQGLQVTPQLGLIPIEADPESGLWEFAHLQTTAPGVDPIPKRDARKRLIVTSDTGLIFVLLPGGTFRMGAMKSGDDHALTDPNVDPEAGFDESPITDVTLDAFFMSKYEMTDAQWERRLGHDDPSWFTLGHNLPVYRVSWEDCAGSAGWITRLGLLLPTEAQWEYAARAGTSTPRWTGVGVEALAKAENIEASRLAAVGSFDPNMFGLHDVLGNVWEWCRDFYGSYDLRPDAHDGLRHPVAPKSRVNRGGSFSSGPSVARSAYRNIGAPNFSCFSLGVRPARSIASP